MSYFKHIVRHHLSTNILYKDLKSRSNLCSNIIICNRNFNNITHPFKHDHIIERKNIFPIVLFKSFKINTPPSDENERILKFSKHCSNQQFDILKSFIEENKTTDFETLDELRQKVLNIEGGRISEHNIDGVILHNASSNLNLSKIYANYLNNRNKKLTLSQLSYLFFSFYTNKNICSKEDKDLICKLFNGIIKQENLSLNVYISDQLIAGISITDEWKDGLKIVDLMKNMPATRDIDRSRLYHKLIEAAACNNDWRFVIEYLNACFDLGDLKLPDALYEKLILEIKNKETLDIFLTFIQSNSIILSKPLAYNINEQCKTYKIYKCTHTSIDNTARECQHCKSQLSALKINENEFNELREVFLEKTVLGKDIFIKSNPDELDDFLLFLKKTAPYDIVMDALNISHTLNTVKARQDETLRTVVDFYLKYNKKILILGRHHIQKWPSLNYFKKNCNIFLVSNMSQDDPYMLYASMYSGLNTKFISRDLMRSHLYLIKNENLKTIFKKWQQLNQIVLLSINRNGSLTYVKPVNYHVIVHREGMNKWHVPYKDENLELTFQNVYNPKSTWLCLEK